MTLDEIGLKCRTDKASDGHNYTPLYEKYFSPMQHLSITLLEIGIGGYEFYDRGGESLRMWKEWFTKAAIYGVDFYAKQGIPGCVILQIPQQNLSVDDMGTFDIIIDDASHINPLTIQTFKNMWAAVKPGGLYVVEDVHTSYWFSEYLGQENDTQPHQSTMGFFQWLTHQLNYEVWPGEHQYTDIEYIHFYKEIIFIKKK